MINKELFLIYLLVSILFIVAIRGLSKPNTALFSNRLGMAGMLLAIVATMFVLPEQNHIWILIAIFAGAVVGVLSATKVKITALPQMVAVFNGLGGLSSTLVAFAQMKNMQTQYLDMSLSVAIGTIAFMGSMIAYLKLQGSFTKILRKCYLSVKKSFVSENLRIIFFNTLPYKTCESISQRSTENTYTKR